MNKNRPNNIKQLVLISLCLSLLATNAYAGVTGTEFSALYLWMLGEVQGYGGKTIALAAVAVGAIVSIAKVNPIPILGGIGFAVFLQYVPTIVTGILSATV